MRLLLFALLCGAAFAQQEASSVTGRVVNGSTNDPVSGARVYLDRQSNPAAYFVTETSADGVFNAVGLDPGVYKLSVEHFGFTPRALRGAVTLGSGQRLANIDFRLEAQGVLAGRVLDTDGDPVPNGSLGIFRRGYVDGVPALRPVNAGNVVLNTDDQGRFRIFGLAPGTYYLRAAAQLGFIDRAPSSNTYYGNTASSADARAIEITPGRELSNLEIHLVNAQTVSVRGHIDNQTGISGQTGASLRSVDGSTQGATTAKDDGFTVNGVLPGRYTLLATMSGPNRSIYFDMQELTVGAQPVDGLGLVLAPPAKLSGKISAAEGIELKGIEVHLEVHGVSLPAANAATRPDGVGAFQVPRLSRGIYDLSLSGLPKGVYLKSAQLEDLDLITSTLSIKGDQVGPIELVLAKGAPTLSGTTSPGAKLALVPDGAERRARNSLYRVAEAGLDGSFSIEGLSPGKYKVFAWQEVEDTAWRNADFLKDYEAAAVPVVLEPNSETHVEVPASAK